MTKRAVLLFLVGLLATPAFAAAKASKGPLRKTNPTRPHAIVFDVKQYGAAGDGKTLDSPAINKAIDAANAAGGGTVYLTAGTYLSGSIHLKSNVTLYLDQGA